MIVFKKITSISCSIALLFSLIIVQAQAQTSAVQISNGLTQSFDKKLDEKIKEIEMVPLSPNASSALKLVDKRVSEFLQENKGSGILGSKKGKKLLNKHRKLRNYLVLKDQLKENCNIESDRNLSDRLLDIAANAELVDSKCAQKMEQFKNFEQYYEDNIGPIAEFINNDSKKSFAVSDGMSLCTDGEVGEQALESCLYYKLREQSIKNAVTTFVDMNYIYKNSKGANNTPWKPADITPIQMQNKICKKDFCSKKIKKLIRDEVLKRQDYLKKNKTKRYWAVQSLQKMRSKLNSLNEKLNKASKEIEPVQQRTRTRGNYGIEKISYKPNRTDEAKRLFQEYQNEYKQFVSSAPGMLLLSEKMKDRLGEYVQDKDLQTSNKNGVSYRYKNHGVVGTDNESKRLFIEARDEALNKMIEQTKSVVGRGNYFMNKNAPVFNKNKKSRSLAGNKDDLAFLLKTNPAAMGQVLLNNPEYSPYICKTIAKVQADDESEEFWDNAFIWGGTIVGTTLLATGIGSGLGAGIIAGSASLAAIETSLALAETVYFAKRAQQKQQEYLAFERAFFGGNGDFQTSQDAKQALEDYNEANIGFYISLGGTFLSGGMLKSTLSNTLDSTSTVNKLKRLNATTKDLRAGTIASKIIAKESRVFNFLEKYKSLGKFSDDDILKLFMKLGKLPKSELKGAVQNFKKLIKDDPERLYVLLKGVEGLDDTKKISLLLDKAKDAGAYWWTKLALKNGMNMAPDFGIPQNLRSQYRQKFYSALDGEMPGINNKLREVFGETDYSKFSKEQREAILYAHLIGRGEVGKDGVNIASIGNYSKSQIDFKKAILKNSGLADEQIAIILRKGIAGDAPTKISDVSELLVKGKKGEIVKRKASTLAIKWLEENSIIENISKREKGVEFNDVREMVDMRGYELYGKRDNLEDITWYRSKFRAKRGKTVIEGKLNETYIYTGFQNGEVKSVIFTKPFKEEAIRKKGRYFFPKNFIDEESVKLKMWIYQPSTRTTYKGEFIKQDRNFVYFIDSKTGVSTKVSKSEMDMDTLYIEAEIPNRQ